MHLSGVRLLAAALLPPLVAVIVFWAGSLTMLALAEPGTLSRGNLTAGAFHTLFFFVFFGFPAACVASALIAWPGYELLKSRGWLRRGPVVLGASGAGALAVPLVWTFFWGTSHVTARDWPELIALGALSGLGAGLTFGVVALPRHVPPTAAASPRENSTAV